MRRFYVWMAIALLVIIADQVTKWAIIQWIPLYGKVPLNSFINITHQQNYGAAFSFLADAGGWQRWFFVVLAVGVSAFIGHWMWRIRAEGQLILAAGLSLVGMLAYLHARDRSRSFSRLAWWLAALLALFAAIHWLCDFVWLEVLSVASHKGSEVMGDRLQRIVLVVCAVALVFYGCRFLYDAARGCYSLFA